ncbi:MAG: DNA repair protein RecN [Clostridia bacterium]
MLTNVDIKNFAIIKDLHILFQKGINVLLGETGAGKTIILSALSFVFGGKADKTFVRTGEDLMSVEAEFTNCQPAKDVIQSLGLEFENDLIFSRSLSLDGKSVCRINGRLVTVAMLKTVSNCLINSFCQNESVEILKQKNHLKLLDEYCPNAVTPFKEQILNICDRISENEKLMKEVGGDSQLRERMIEIKKFQIAEIENAKLFENEDSQILSKLQIISNSEKLIEQISIIQKNLQIEQIKTAQHAFEIASTLDCSLANDCKRFKTVIYELDDIFDDLTAYIDNVAFNQVEFDKLDLRYDLIKTLKKKYGGTISEILEFLEKTKKELQMLETSEETLNELQLKQTKLEKEATAFCKKLTEARKTIAKEVEDKIKQELEPLGMKNAKFQVKFTTNDGKNYASYDEVEFMFSANAGEEVKSLAKTISGGEMSRFMLAVKNVLAEKDGVSLLLFDEVDSGISGVIGAKVAEKIAKLSKTFQIICITHLPQVASMADCYFFVSKSFDGVSTKTVISKLKGNNAISQIAGLFSGEFNSSSAITHAGELKHWCDNFKNTL